MTVITFPFVKPIGEPSPTFLVFDKGVSDNTFEPTDSILPRKALRSDGIEPIQNPIRLQFLGRRRFSSMTMSEGMRMGGAISKSKREGNQN